METDILEILKASEQGSEQYVLYQKLVEVIGGADSDANGKISFEGSWLIFLKKYKWFIKM